MILDRLSNAEMYRKLSERFAIGFDYLAQDLSHVPDGRYEIQGDQVFAMVQSYDTKPREQGKWEPHRQYADIQFMITGREPHGDQPDRARAESVTLRCGEGRGVFQRRWADGHRRSGKLRDLSAARCSYADAGG